MDYAHRGSFLAVSMMMAGANGRHAKISIALAIHSVDPATFPVSIPYYKG